jgi:hypothetical protein
MQEPYDLTVVECAAKHKGPCARDEEQRAARPSRPRRAAVCGQQLAL